MMAPQHEPKERWLSNSRLIATARIVLMVLLCGGVGWYVSAHWNEFSRITEIPAYILGLVFATRFFGYLASVEAVRQLANSLSRHVGWFEFLLLWSTGSVLSTVAIPWSGYAIKTVYLKRRHALPHGEFLAINVIVATGSLCVSGLLAFAALSSLQLSLTEHHFFLWLGAMIMAACPILFLLSEWIVPPIGPLHRLLHEHRRWRSTKLEPRIFAKVSTLLIFRGLANFLGFGILFMALAHPGSGIVIGGLIDCMVSLLRLIRLVPGNLGLYEWGVAVVGNSLGVSLVTGITAAALYCICGLAVVTSCAAVLSVQKVLHDSLSSRERIRKSRCS